MMRIAVAGGTGLGYLLATQLSQATNAYNVVVLSRFARPDFAALDIAVQVVDYSDAGSLSFALQGVDLILSTVAGRPQLALIQAAARSRVRAFVPAEFEGCPGRRPSLPGGPEGPDAERERASAACLALLRQLALQSRMRHTVFSCGIFMERLHPLGLAALAVGRGCNADRPADFLVDLVGATAEYPDRDTKGRPVRLCLCSIHDVVAFVVAAVDLGIDGWPAEFTMRGDRLTVRELVETCSLVRNVEFEHQVRSVADLQALAACYLEAGDVDRAAYYRRLLATAHGRYDFGRASLNDAIERSGGAVGVRPKRLAQWLASIYHGG